MANSGGIIEVALIEVRVQNAVYMQLDAQRNKGGVHTLSLGMVGLSAEFPVPPMFSSPVQSSPSASSEGLMLTTPARYANAQEGSGQMAVKSDSGRDPLRLDLIDLLMEGNAIGEGPMENFGEIPIDFNGPGASFFSATDAVSPGNQKPHQLDSTRGQILASVGHPYASHWKEPPFDTTLQKHERKTSWGSTATDIGSIDLSENFLILGSSDSAMSVSDSFVSIESTVAFPDYVGNPNNNSIMRDVTRNKPLDENMQKAQHRQQQQQPVHQRQQQPRHQMYPTQYQVYQHLHVHKPPQLDKHCSLPRPGTQIYDNSALLTQQTQTGHQQKPSFRGEDTNVCIDYSEPDHSVARGVDGMYPCGLCEMKFKQTGNRKKHVEETHFRRKPFLCSVCNSSFSRKHARDTHLRAVHEQLRPYECPYCHKLYKNRSDLNKHIRTVEKREKPFSCATCGRCFGERGKLRRHTAIHKKPGVKMPDAAVAS